MTSTSGELRFTSTPLPWHRTVLFLDHLRWRHPLGDYDITSTLSTRRRTLFLYLLMSWAWMNLSRIIFRFIYPCISADSNSISRHHKSVCSILQGCTQHHIHIELFCCGHSQKLSLSRELYHLVIDRELK